MNPGTQVGPYRVESLIGSGGMGEVYLATDTRLDRNVAIKVLSQRVSADPSLRERFDREAKTISSLNHPNICSLFDLGQHDGVSYLVMEYLQGETLADRIARGPIPAQQTIRIGIEIANALAAAHKQGIVHRDLKPGNVMLTKAGVKLLDFGLAKLSAHAADEALKTSLATEQKPLTEQGAILGTFQYMSPEALEGREADARSDIFALGAILYEMVTARRAFQGTSRASLIASILDRDPPPMSELQPMAPAALERIVRACLAKDPDDRIQTAHDVALELKWIGESSSVVEPSGVRRRRKLAPWIAAGLLAVIAAALGAMYWIERGRPGAPYTLSILPPQDTTIQTFGISPDGRSVALVAWSPKKGARSLWLRRLEDGALREIASNVGSRRWPAWSPDGAWIAFEHSSGRLMRVRVEGGEPETVARTATSGRIAWSEDGTLLFATIWGAGLSRVPATGGDPAVVTRLDVSRRESYHGNPHFLPGGKRFLYIVHTVSEKRNEIWAGSLDGAKPVQVASADALVGYVEPYLLFVRDGAIYAQRFDPGKPRVSGDAVRVIDSAMFWESAADAAASLSPAGPLLFMPFRPTRISLNVYDRSGALVRTLWEGDNFENPSLTRDEKTLVVNKLDPIKGASDIVAVDLARGIETRLTGGLAQHANPLISPDEQNVVFFSDRDGMYDVYRKPIDGTSPEQVIWKDERDKEPLDWSPDGKHLLVLRTVPGTGGDIWVCPIGTGEKPSLFVGSERSEGEARFSPDGKSVAYNSAQSGDMELYVRSFPTGRAVRVSADGGGAVAWTRDGRELIWVAKGNRVMSASVDLSGPSPQVGTPKQLFTMPRIWSAPIVMRDGTIAFTVPAPGADTSPALEFTTAWRAKLK